MRWILALMVSVLLVKASDSIVVVPVFKQQGHRGFAAYWQAPTNGIWVAEWSTNLVHWERCTNHQVYESGLSFTETGADWTTRFYVRLRRVQ